MCCFKFGDEEKEVLVVMNYAGPSRLEAVVTTAFAVVTTQLPWKQRAAVTVVVSSGVCFVHTDAAHW